MKKLLLLPIFAVLMSFSQCDKDNFDKKPPVEFTKVYFQEWVGGRPGSSGTLVTLITKNIDSKIVFDSIYFNKKVIKLEANIYENELTLTGNFIKQSAKDNDLILSGDSKEEFGNEPPKIELKIPFKLVNNECVISYFIKDKKRYFRLKNIRKEKTLYYQ